MFFEAVPPPHFFSTEHEQFRDVLRAFVSKEITPFVHTWDEAGGFPRELYKKAGELGVLGVGFPEQYGGTPGDEFYKIIAGEEIARAGSGGVSAALYSHDIGLPPSSQPEARA